MPITPTGIATAVAAGLLSTGHHGAAVPQLASGIGAGVFAYLTGSLKVVTVDVGTVGAGSGSITLSVPQPLILSALTAGFTAQGLNGSYAPLTVLGLSIGLSTAFPQGLVTTAHAGVGAGTGVVKTVPTGSAVTSMIAGFSSVQMTSPGSVRKATAIGLGLDIIFAAYTTVTPILGGAGPTPSTGAGFGTIV